MASASARGCDELAPIEAVEEEQDDIGRPTGLTNETKRIDDQPFFTPGVASDVGIACKMNKLFQSMAPHRQLQLHERARPPKRSTLDSLSNAFSNLALSTIHEGNEENEATNSLKTHGVTPTGEASSNPMGR